MTALQYTPGSAFAVQDEEQDFCDLMQELIEQEGMSTFEAFAQAPDIADDLAIYAVIWDTDAAAAQGQGVYVWHR